MDGDKDRYSDFSDDWEMQSRFAGRASSAELDFQAEALRQHLEYDNPITRITGLLGHGTLVTCGFAFGIKRLLNRVIILLGVIAAILGFIAFQLVYF